MRIFLLASCLLSLSEVALSQGLALRNMESEDRILGSYIVTFKDEGLRALESKALQMIARGADVQREYHTVLHGYAIQADDSVIESLKADPSVESITANVKLKAFAVQEDAVWGIDRIDAARGSDGLYNFFKTGIGVHAYVIDTGVRASHLDFKGRMGEGFDAVRDGNGTNDCNGHGSHVAGTIGGSSFGVAKKVTIHPVRVLDCIGEGSLATVLEGIEFVASKAIKPAVANMSLGGGVDETLDLAVAKAIDKGITFVLAAGNEGQDACNVSPARVAKAITVGASDKDDTAPLFSNFGKCVDIFAPGVEIESVGIASDRSTALLDGTSMSAPHVAGAVALLLEENKNLKPDQVASALLNQSTKNVLRDLGENSPNRMLFTKP